MLSKLIAAPLMALALFFLYLTWESSPDYATYIVPCVIGLAVIYILSPQIDWWWYSKYPPALDGKLRKLIESKLGFYQRLPESEKERFRNRVALFMLGTNFMGQGGMDEVPEDVKGVIAAQAVQFTFGLDTFLTNKFENVIVYPRQFPSPQFPKQWHASEIFEEDGAILFSAERLMQAFIQPTEFYNIGLHEYAKVFRIQHPEIQFPTLPESIWEDLKTISRFPKSFLEDCVGLPLEDPLPVSLAHFLMFPNGFREVLPDLFEQYRTIFKMGIVHLDV